MTEGLVYESTAPLLDFENARVARADGSIGEAHSFRVEGARAALIGPFTFFFALLSGKASLASGTARIAGADAAHSVREGRVGLSLLDPELPAKFTGKRYLEESALLTGLSRRDASRAVATAVQRFALAPRIDAKLTELTLVERRALSIVSATLGDPPVLCAEAPLYRLDEAQQSYLQGVLLRAGERSALVVSIPELPAAGGERAFADSLGAVVHERQGASASWGRSSCVVSLVSGSEAFLRKLEERGLAYRALGADPLLLGLARGESHDLARFVVDLADDMTENDLFVLAREADAALIELVRE